ncbi:MAG: hypothetical protein HUN04_12605 [Desulfobacter sp.]|nr:MAG: hypothetical protein HUN04_12605 [Desulfobacter sp.]
MEAHSGGSKDPGKQGPEKKNFLWIKQGLDPKSGYVIFEHDLKYRGQSIFDTGHRVYAFLKKKGLSWQQVVDMDLSMEYLVIRVPPGEEDRTLGRILGYGFPEHMVYYIFKAEEV